MTKEELLKKIDEVIPDGHMLTDLDINHSMSGRTHSYIVEVSIKTWGRLSE